MWRCRGSSPLTRGKPRRIFRRVRRPGLIPAHAGKTSLAGPFNGEDGAHPRSRGENVAVLACGGVDLGSSPLTRGKQNRVPCKPGDAGLIPAHAGKTVRSGTRRRRAGAHPRSRGENLANALRVIADERLIPAHAGKTPLGSALLGTVRAHPRSRGENELGKRRVEGVKGSSPLTRGKRRRMDRRRARRRLIPAHAGKTVADLVDREETGAHPRSRGENP